MASHEPTDSDTRSIFRLLCLLMGTGSAALFMVRLQTHASAFEFGVLLGLVVLAPTLWALARSGRARIDTLTLWTLTPIVVCAQVAHGVLPTSRFALTYLGTLVVFGALLLPVRTFSAFGVLLVVGAGISRTVRHLNGYDTVALGIGLTHVVGGMLAFVLTIALLQRHHERVVLFLSDATATARQEAELAFAATLAKSQFLANMHHELRTPLNAILGYAELLLDDEHPEEATAGLDAIHTAGQALLGQVDEVLDNARTEAMTSDPEPRDLTAPGAPPVITDVPALVSEATRVRLRRGAGVFICAAASLGGLAAAATPEADSWAPIAATLVVGLLVSFTAVRAPGVSEVLLLVGSTTILAGSEAAIPQTQDVESYGYFLVALSALLLPTRRFVAATFAITLLLGLAAAIRVLRGFDGAAEAVIPWIAHLLVVVPLWLVVTRRETLVRARTQQLDEARRSRRRARQAERARTDFLGRMSHEIRTPLTTIIGNAEALEDDLVDPDDQDDLARIQAAGRHLQGILDDVLDMATFERGDPPLRLQPTDVHELCRRATNLVQPLLDESGNTLHLDLAPCPALSCDARRLTQVLVNLLGNAAKFTDGGTIELSVRAEGSVVVIAVRDEGPGIAPAQQERLFLPFERLDAATSVAGTGLGLAIAHRLVAQHGGHLEVDSVPGEGATFRIRLPLAD